MDTWKYIGTGIRSIQMEYHPGENIFLRVDRRPESSSVWKDCADDQAYGHADKKEGAQPVIALLVSEEEIKDRSAYV